MQAGKSKEIAKIETEPDKKTRILYIGHCWHEKTVWTLDTKGRASIQWQTQLGTPASLFWLNYQVPYESKVVIENNDTIDHDYTVVLAISKGYTKASELTDANLCMDTLASSNIEIEVAKKKTTPITRTIENHGGSMWWQG